MLGRVLIANRGEIAIRIARAAAGLGMESVADYAPVDEHALHARVTSQSRPLPRDGVAGYLDGDALVRAALAAGCDCVLPGYGCLVEHAGFAEACIAAPLNPNLCVD